MIEPLTLFALSVGIGVFAGLLGLGGGVLIIPLLTLSYGASISTAVAVSLLAVIPTSMAASTVYLESGKIDFETVIPMCFFAATGGVIGGLIAGFVPVAWLELLFAVILAYSAVATLLKKDGNGDSAHDPNRFWRRLKDPVTFLAGILTGLVGLGGGVILIPLMYLGLGLPIRMAMASSAFIVGVSATAGATVFVMRGGLTEVFSFLPSVVTGMLLGAFLGGKLGVRAAPAALKALFAVVLVYFSYRMALTGAGRLGWM